MSDYKPFPRYYSVSEGYDKTLSYYCHDQMTAVCELTIFACENIENKFQLLSKFPIPPHEHKLYNLHCPKCGNVMHQVRCHQSEYILGLYKCIECENKKWRTI